MDELVVVQTALVKPLDDLHAGTDERHRLDTEISQQRHDGRCLALRTPEMGGGLQVQRTNVPVANHRGASAVTRARVVRWLALAAALAIMIVLVARLGPSQIVDELQHVGANAAWLLVVYVAGTAIGALPYYVLFPPHERPTVRSALLGRFAASGINVIVPLF